MKDMKKYVPKAQTADVKDKTGQGKCLIEGEEIIDRLKVARGQITLKGWGGAECGSERQAIHP